MTASRTAASVLRSIALAWCMAGVLPHRAVAQAIVSSESSEDIIVTARRRQERLDDVGLSVRAISRETLTRQRLDSLVDLTRVVPGLSYAPSPDDTPVYTLRGVGFFDSSVAAYPDVATYLDQAPLALPAFSKLTMFDLERVEVVKGPQGTLFGNNATGGAINFVAAKPTDQFTAGTDLTYGRFNRVELNEFVSGPLTDRLKARFAAKVSHVDDWQRSQSRDDTLGAIRTVAGRLIIDWRPNDELHFSLDLNGWRDRSDPPAPQLARQTTPADLQVPIGTTGATGTVGADFPLLSVPAAPDDPRIADWDPDHRPYADNGLWQIALSSNWAIAPNLELRSITNYVDYRMLNATEGDGTALVDLDIIRDHARARSFFQELRLGDRGTGAVRWVVGGSIDKTRIGEAIDLRFPDSSSGSEQGFSGDSYDSEQHVRNLATFGNVEWRVVPPISLKVGARYTWARRSASNGSYESPGYTEPFPGSPGLTNLINYLWKNVYIPLFCPGTPFTPIVRGQSVTINPQTCQTGRFYDILAEHNFSWLGGIDWRPAQGMLVYINISRGYKNGSFPIVSAPTAEQYQPVTQEALTDYEGGFKARLLKNALTVDGTFFHYVYREKQVRAKTVNPIFGLLDQLVNVPRSRIDGAELELEAHPVRALALSTSATWLSSKVESYDGIVGATRIDGLLFPIRASFRGVELPFSPHFQIATSADYAFPINGRWRGHVGTTVTGQTRSYASLELAPQDKSDALLPGRTLIDLRAGIDSRDGHWRVDLWGTNITNRFYITNKLRSYDTIVRYAGRPAEYGLTIGYRW